MITSITLPEKYIVKYNALRRKLNLEFKYVSTLSTTICAFVGECMIYSNADIGLCILGEDVNPICYAFETLRDSDLTDLESIRQIVIQTHNYFVKYNKAVIPNIVFARRDLMVDTNITFYTIESFIDHCCQQ